MEDLINFIRTNKELTIIIVAFTISYFLHTLIHRTNNKFQ